MNRILAIILTLAFVLSLSGVAFAATAHHETIDGFDSYYVTGNAEVETTPVLYNVRENELHVEVEVTNHSGVDATFDNNEIVLYHDDGDDEVDRTEDFDFGVLGDGEVQSEIVKLDDAEDLDANFALSTYISKDNDD